MTCSFDPQPGDRLSSEGTFWVHVVARLGPYVVVEEYDAPCAVPDDARVRIFKNPERFHAAYQVPGSSKLWLHYWDNDAPLRHVQRPEERASDLPAAMAKQTAGTAAEKTERQLPAQVDRFVPEDLPPGLAVLGDFEPTARCDAPPVGVPTAEISLPEMAVISPPEPMPLIAYERPRYGDDPLLQLVVEHTLIAAGATGATIAITQGSALVCQAAAGTTAPKPGMWLKDETGILYECLQTDRVLKCADTHGTQLTVWGGFRRAGIRSVLIVPLRNAGGIIGVFSSEPNAFRDRDMAAMCITSEMVSVLLENRLPWLAAEPARAPQLLPALA